MPRRGKLLKMAAWPVTVLFICSGCATARHPVPEEMIGTVRVGSMAEIRTISGIPNRVLQENLIRSFIEEDPRDYPVGADGKRTYPALAISGGAANGAYGAGLLKGWTKSGTRPKFKLITGVSTGAIIAPLVFIGPEYDDTIEELYTTMSTKDVMSGKGPLQILFGNSMASNKPLERQIDRYLTAEILRKVAAQHRKGRRLFVGTTLLDDQRFVIWDMGAIAARGDLEIFRKVVLASAAIPVIFPPVFIHVEADGRCYDEMHVDGGTMTQIFTMYKVLEDAESIGKEMGITKDRLGVDPAKIRGSYYIIRNGYVTPGYKPVKDNIGMIADRSFDTIINTQAIGDTYRIYAFMKKRGNDYNLAYIPGDFRPKATQMFDPQEMKELFDRGYADAVNGYKWHKAPPGFEDNDTEERSFGRLRRPQDDG